MSKIIPLGCTVIWREKAASPPGGGVTYSVVVVGARQIFWRAAGAREEGGVRKSLMDKDDR